jgi:DNA-binding HxlR family transcriptional regulator
MSGYGQYCPVAKAAEVLGEKWSILILRELCIEDQTFNGLRKGMPLLSPTLLSKRLKTLVHHNVIARTKTGKGVYYSLTDAGSELKEMIMQLGVWGQRWVRSDYSDGDLDASLLMWDLHRSVNTDPFPIERKVIQFEFYGTASRQRFFWLVVEDQNVEVCMKSPGYDVDLSIKADLKAFTTFWMGDMSFTRLGKEKKLSAEGDAHLKRSMKHWLCCSAFADVKSASA